MNEYAPLHNTAMDILEESLLKFHLPTAISSFKDTEIKQMAKLVWAMQILLKELIEYTGQLGYPQDLKERLNRIEKYMIISKGVLTSDEVCEILDISTSHLYYIVRKKGLRSLKPQGKLMFFKVEDVVKWCMSHPGRDERPIERTALLNTDRNE